MAWLAPEGTGKLVHEVVHVSGHRHEPIIIICLPIQPLFDGGHDGCIYNIVIVIEPGCDANVDLTGGGQAGK